MLPSATTEARPQTERLKRSNTRSSLLMAGALLASAGSMAGVKTFMDVLPRSEPHVVVEEPTPGGEPAHTIPVSVPDHAPHEVVIEVTSFTPTTTEPK